MLIIPVIDLKSGLVVHAKQGARDNYQPITSKISASAKPEIVVSSFLQLYPFRIIYIADLDAIQKTGPQFELVLGLARENKQCEFWLDAGVEIILDKKIDTLPNNIKLILGSENKLDENELTALIKERPDLILSLDFDAQGLVENPYLIDKPSIWPQQIIVMSLSNVGSNKGVDISHLNTILSMAKNKTVYAAGGVRNKEDLSQLKSIGVKGALLATALHSGAITKEDLEGFLKN